MRLQDIGIRFYDINVNWFDLVVLAVLVLGIIRGRKHGMSGEAFPLLQWLLILIIGAYTYEVGGVALDTACGLGLGFSFIAVYLLQMLVLSWFFAGVKHRMSDKLLSSNAFGKGEYAFGMAAGAIRFLCILMVCMSVFRLFHVSEADRQSTARKQKESLGNIELPSLGSIQQDVFQRSLTGPTVVRHLSTLLMKPPPPPVPGKRETLGKQRTRMLDEAGGAK